MRECTPEYPPSSADADDLNRSESDIWHSKPASREKAMAATIAQPQRTVKIPVDDPFTSLFTPSFDPGPIGSRNKDSFANQQINPSTHKAQTYIRDVEPKFSDPLLQQPSTLANDFVPKTEFVKAKRSARDAWFAVTFLCLLIAGGTYYFADRVTTDGEKIDNLSSEVTSLNTQLQSSQGVVIARNKEIQMLNDQLSEERHKIASKKK
jgi:hypothetical protein